jgi:hypothetical protein
MRALQHRARKPLPAPTPHTSASQAQIQHNGAIHSAADGPTRAESRPIASPAPRPPLTGAADPRGAQLASVTSGAAWGCGSRLQRQPAAHASGRGPFSLVSNVVRRCRLGRGTAAASADFLATARNGAGSAAGAPAGLLAGGSTSSSLPQLWCAGRCHGGGRSVGTAHSFRPERPGRCLPLWLPILQVRHSCRLYNEGRG